MNWESLGDCKTLAPQLRLIKISSHTENAGGIIVVKLYEPLGFSYMWFFLGSWWFEKSWRADEWFFLLLWQETPQWGSHVGGLWYQPQEISWGISGSTSGIWCCMECCPGIQQDNGEAQMAQEIIEGLYIHGQRDCRWDLCCDELYAISGCFGEFTDNIFI